MGNKDAGRRIASLDNISYIQAMGGEAENKANQNTGIAFTNYEVWKYFRRLREFALNRIKWTSTAIPEKELRLIEWNIFHYGYCAMLRPVLLRNGVRYKLSQPRIYRCNYTEFNTRTGEPITIALTNHNNNRLTIELNYTADDVVIFTDEYCFENAPNPFYNIAWEYACKFHELDLMFNANSHKMRMPLVFNNGGQQIDKDGKIIRVQGDLSIAEIMRSAYGRNEQFVEIPQNMVGNNFMHEVQYVQNETGALLEAHKKLYEAYFELLGLYTNKEKRGVYTIKALQADGDETGDYITEVLKNTRLLCAKQAVEKFQIDLTMEVL